MNDAGTETVINGIENFQGIRLFFQYLKEFPRTTIILHESAQIATDKTTGQDHLYHRAHWHEGKLYYRGKVLVDSAEETE